MRLFSPRVSIAIPFGDSMAINLDRTLSRNGRKRWQIVEHPLFGENLMESSQRYSGFRLLRSPARRKTTADSDNEKLSGRLLRQHRGVQSHYVIRLFYVRLFYVGNASARGDKRARRIICARFHQRRRPGYYVTASSFIKSQNSEFLRFHSGRAD
jgi:hypothetical protein